MISPEKATVIKKKTKKMSFGSQNQAKVLLC